MSYTIKSHGLANDDAPGYDPVTNTVQAGCVVDSWPAIYRAAARKAQQLGKPPPRWLGGGIMPVPRTSHGLPPPTWLGQVDIHCPPGAILSSQPDSAGVPHPVCTPGKTMFLYDTLNTVKSIPGAYAEMLRDPFTRFPAFRVAALSTGLVGVAGLGVWIARGRKAPTSVKVVTPLAVIASLAATALRNGLM